MDMTPVIIGVGEASERIGRNHAYLQQFFERGVPATLPEGVRERLASLLGVTPGPDATQPSPGPRQQRSDLKQAPAQ